MKLCKILLSLAVAILAAGCFSDDTNRDYTTLDKPVIENPDKDPALFYDHATYKLKLHDRLLITPNVVYKDMNDLSYTWIINGETVSETKDLDWECDIEDLRVSGVYIITRNSAGNADIYSFTVELDQPFLTGYSLLVEKEGQLRHDFISYQVLTLYAFTYHENAGHDFLSFSGSNPRLQEYWSCESSSITGEQMFLDPEPANCTSISGKLLSRTLSLPQEFINDQVPANLRVKDMMHGGFVSYILSEDGRVFQRKGTHAYYTGRFSDLPMQYQGKQIKGEKLVNTKYGEGYGLLYDKTDEGGRFLLINLDYNVDADYTGAKAGQIVEFPEDSQLSGIEGYELVDCWFIKNADVMAGSSPSGILAIFSKGGNYYAREVNISFDSKSQGVDTEEVYPDTYVELPEYGPGSKACPVRVDGGGYFASGYFYYTSDTNPRKVLVKAHKSEAAPKEFHTFDQPVMAIAEGTMKSNNCYLSFAFDDGKVIMYTTSNRTVGSGVNFLTFEEDRIVETFQVDGKVRWMGFKYGNYSNF